MGEEADAVLTYTNITADDLVVGIRDAGLSEKLQMGAGLTLEKAKTAIRQKKAVKQTLQEATSFLWKRSNTHRVREVKVVADFMVGGRLASSPGLPLLWEKNKGEEGLVNLSRD